MPTQDVLAELDGTIVEVSVETGDAVSEGDPIVLMESMKMEVPACSPFAGRVVGIRVSVGDVVTAGSVLATMEK